MTNSQQTTSQSHDTDEDAVAKNNKDKAQAQAQAQPQTNSAKTSSAPSASQTPPNSASKPSLLLTFKKPQPSARLASFLTPVNRWLFLGGIPGLRSVPGLRRIPGIRGLTNIQKIDFPKADELRLADAVSTKNVCFMVPNHPEFFTDWMLDKEIMSRLAPKAASWATHDVVNGMGEGAQKFWLKNNLIAQIPGAGGAEGKAYSIEWALKGHGVLLHPEGAVGWHGDLIGRLYTGAVDMAIAAAKRSDKDRQVLVAPIIWKLKYHRDESRALHKELDYVETALQLPKTAKSVSLEQRVYKAYDALLARDESRYGLQTSAAPFFERQDILVARILKNLSEKLDGLSAPPARSNEQDELIRRGERWLRSVDRKSDDAKAVRKLTKDLRLILRLHEGVYTGPQLTQEQIGENIKRIRNDYCKASKRDTVNSFLPQPAGPRTAHIRIPEPLDVGALYESTPVPALMEDLRMRMQMTLDTINADLAAAGNVINYPNPFKR